LIDRQEEGFLIATTLGVVAIAPIFH